MEKTYQIPRVRLFENDFPTKIPNGTEDSFLEVVNRKGETIALLFLFSGLDDKVFTDVIELVKYYDEVNICRNDYSAWQLAEYLIQDLMEKYKISDRDQVFENQRVSEFISEYYDCASYSNYGFFFRILVCYGRLKYPFGLEKLLHAEYKSELSNIFNDFVNNWILQDNENEYKDDFIEIVNFCLKLLHFRVDLRDIEFFIELGPDIFMGLAENLLTIRNIDWFIKEAKKLENTEILEFLMDIKGDYLNSYNPF